MKIVSGLRVAVAVCLALTAMVSWARAAVVPVRVLIQSGQNNHDWKTTTEKIRSILLADGRFSVEVTEHPEKFTKEEGQKFDVLLSNWNSWGDSGVKEWPTEAREAFLEFVRQGKGLVVVHAGGSSFMDWDDYQNLIGGTWGKETGHGAVHTFSVKPVDTEHPITRGLSTFSTTDELWHRMGVRSPHVIATAFSEAATGGSGKDEPVAFVTRFGKGRCFNLVLGHDTRAMVSAGFQILLRRGTEWAARESVTIPASPAEDPALIQAVLDSIQGYRFGDSREGLLRAATLVAEAGPRGSAVLAKAMAERLAAPKTTLEAKQFLCEQLGVIGTPAEVPALSGLLTDDSLFDLALLALQRIPGSAARQALTEALPRVSGAKQAAIFNTFAARGELESIPAIAKGAKSSDPVVSAAALRALGRFGGGASLQALSGLESEILSASKPELRRAQIAIASTLVEAGDAGTVGKLIAQLQAPSEPADVRGAALLLEARNPGAETGGRLLQALRSEDAPVREAALSGLKLKANREALVKAVRELKQFDPAAQKALLSAVEEVRAREALGGVLETFTSGQGDLRLAAVTTAGALGDGTTVAPLVEALGKANEAERRELSQALMRLPGAGVDEAVMGSMQGAPAPTKVTLVEVLVARNPAGVSALLVEALKSDSEAVRAAAATGVGRVGTLEAAPALIAILRSPGAAEETAATSALAEIYRREGNLDSLEKELRTASPSTQTSLLGVAAAVGGASGLKLVERGIQSKDAEVALASVRLLSEWPDPAAFQPLCEVVKQAVELRNRTLALRGIARLAPQVKSDTKAAAETLAGLLPGANASEKRTLLTALGELPGGAGTTAVIGYVKDNEVGSEARLAAMKALETLDPGEQQLGKSSLATLRAASQDPALDDRLKALEWKFSELPNLSLGAVATSTTGLSPDGQGGPASSAIDGKPETYWDEVDNQKLYAIKVELKKPAKVMFLRIMGWQQGQHAPKDFEVLCDGKAVSKVTEAKYQANWLTVPLNGVGCRTVELKITGYYAASPAIRELEIRGQYEPGN